MNKDVIYIEPEDDIIDVVNHIKTAKQKVVALVPPKKLGILRSAINIKLITKASKQFNKVVVLVTSDASVLKLAATAGIPVAKNLQSRPVIPKLEAKSEKKTDVETIAEEDISTDDEPEAPVEKPNTKATEKTKKSEDIHLNSTDIEDAASKKTNKSNKAQKDTKKIPNFDKYRKFIIAGAVAAVALVVFLVWAFGFSASADITVKIRTSSSSFGENINFVSKESDVNAAEGKLLLEKVEYSKEAKVEFEATGEKDFGNKASGTLTIFATLSRASESYSVPKGSQFATAGLAFSTTEDIVISWPDGDVSLCVALSSYGCTIEKDVNVMAVEGGEKYNISTAGRDAWSSSVAGVSAYNAAAFTGGTTNLAKVVTKEDIAKAKEKLETSADGKEELLEKVNKNEVISIDASYAATPGDPKSSPAEGEKAENGKATLTAKTTYTMFVVNKSAVSDFVTSSIQSSLGPDQKVYDIGSPFFERFVENNGVYTAKLKTTIKTGPEVTEATVREKALGKKVGEVQSLIQSINGVSSVKVDTPYPWVNNVPDDDKKVTISIEVEE